MSDAATKQVAESTEAQGCSQNTAKCMNSKPGWEWRALLCSYGTFYLFMAGWFALHLSVMVDMMPAWSGDPRVFTLNGLELSAPRNQRFQMNSIATAGGVLGDKSKPDATLVATPWSSNAVPVTSRSVRCPTAEEPCAVSQQIRILNNHNLRFIGNNEIKIKCEFTGTTTDATFGEFSDPIADQRTDPNWNRMSARNARDAHISGSGSELTVEAGATLTYLGPNKVALAADAKSFTVTFVKDASAPHIVEFKVAQSVSGVASASCEVDLTAGVIDEYWFDEPADDEFEFGVDSETKRSFTTSFLF